MIELCILGVEGSFGRIIRTFTKTYKNMEMDMFYLTLKKSYFPPQSTFNKLYTFITTS